MDIKVRVTRKKDGGPVKVPVHTELIKLQEFMKLCDAVPSGGMAKTFIQNGEVTVNGVVETQRGKKLRPGDQVGFMGNIWQVTADGD